MQRVPEAFEVLQRQLLHLVGGVAPREVRPQGVALDRLGQDDRRLAVVVHRRLIGRIHLVVVEAAPLELPPDVLVGPVRHHRPGARVLTEEVLPHIAAIVGAEGLVVAVGGLVHQVHQGAVVIYLDQRVPPSAPDDLDDVPAGTAEGRLQLLDDLAVAADRTVEPLQVAVDHEGEVVELIIGRDLQEAT